MRVALLGCGVVGSDVVRLLDAHRDDLAQRVGAPIELAGIAVRRPTRDRDLPVSTSLSVSFCPKTNPSYDAGNVAGLGAP